MSADVGARVVVHDIDQARLALRTAARLDIAVTLQSAPGAAAALGPGVFREMITAAAAAEARPEPRAVLDCGCDPGIALAALRAGIRTVRLGGDVPAIDAVRDIAAKSGGVVETDIAPAFDLAAPDADDAALVRWLEQHRR